MTTKVWMLFALFVVMAMAEDSDSEDSNHKRRQVATFGTNQYSPPTTTFVRQPASLLHANSRRTFQQTPSNAVLQTLSVPNTNLHSLRRNQLLTTNNAGRFVQPTTTNLNSLNRFSSRGQNLRTLSSTTQNLGTLSSTAQNFGTLSSTGQNLGARRVHLSSGTNLVNPVNRVPVFRNDVQTSRPLDPSHEILVSRSTNDGAGNYQFGYSTANGITHEEAGTPVGLNSYAVQGAYSYTSPEGVLVTVNYVADENGFQVDSPNVPPMPEHSRQQVLFAQEARRLGINLEDGFDQSQQSSLRNSNLHLVSNNRNTLLRGTNALNANRRNFATESVLGTNTIGNQRFATESVLGTNAIGNQRFATESVLGTNAIGNRRFATVNRNLVNQGNLRTHQFGNRQNQGLTTTQYT